MVHPSEYAQWYYLIYLLPGGVALLLLLLSALGGGMHHHHHVGAGHGHHGLGHHGAGHHGAAHHGAGHHAPAAHGRPAQTHGQPAAHGQTHGAGTAGRTPPSLIAFFGLGRVPAPLVWGSALLGWGVFGFWGTQFWEQHLHFAAAFALPALATALAGALVTEKATVEAASRLLPRDESYATSAVELCGLTGTVVFATDDARGRLHVYDAHGTLHDVSARSAPGQGRIARGRRALVTDYDAARDQVIVEEAP